MEFWNGEIHWVTTAEMQDDTFEIASTERKLTADGLKSAGLLMMPVGTILLSSRAPIGKVAIAGIEMCCNQGFKNLICGKDIYNKYLFWYLKSRKEYLNRLGRSATFKEISKAIVGSIRIPLPPMEEKKRITAMLDKAREAYRPAQTAACRAGRAGAVCFPRYVRRTGEKK